MKYKLLAGAMALALIGCAEKSADETSASAEAIDAASSAVTESRDAEAVPDIGLDAAPGVAFDYSYSFRLADDRIASAQQSHAEACERLGTTRCRISDVRYGLSENGNVEAQTQFKLDPALARRFGADAIDSVKQWDGVLADTAIGGEDVGSQITASQQRSAGIGAEIDRIEARLKQPGLSKTERSDLAQRLSSLKGQTEEEQSKRRDGEARIASTSVSFRYVGKGGLPGIGHDNPFEKAGATFLQSGGTALSLILTTGAALLPWALVLALLIAIWRSGPVRRLRASAKVKASEQPKEANS
jgi:hypothetical protein